MKIFMKKILYIILIGFSIRLIAIYSLGNFKNNFYWEYGEIAKNLNNNKGYSLFYIDKGKLEYHYTTNSNPKESAYMPPGYTYFLSPFIYIENITLRNILIYITQSIISVLTIFFVYILTKFIFTEKTAIIAAIIIAVVPEFIYTTLSFTPTTFYHLMVVLLLLISIKLDSRKNKYVYYYGIIISFLIYFRSEFVLFWFLSILYFIYNKKFKFSIRLLLIVFIFISPWLIRNYITFNKFIPLSTSFGLNFYRGNNPYGIGDWGDERINNKILNLNSTNLEIEYNNIYKEEAISYIINNPINEIKNIFNKIYYFWIFNKTDKRSYNPLYLFPSFIILIFSLYGIILSFNWNKYKFFYLFFIYSNLIIIIFFPLLRYNTMMKIGLLPFTAYGIVEAINFLKNKYFV